MEIELLVQAKKAVRCWDCGSNQFQIESYPHDGGWNTPEGKRWFFLTCSKCGYQTSFDKLGISRNATGAGFSDVLKRIHPDVCGGHPKATDLTQKLLNYRNHLGVFFKKYRDELLELMKGAV